MKLINTDGMAFIGPGSEWFWTAVSGLILVVTFLAIYRQLRIARNASAFEQLDAFEQQLDSERMVRFELAVLTALRDGVDPAHLPQAPAEGVSNLWEKTGALARRGHLDPKLLWEGSGGAVRIWWPALAPYARRIRAEWSIPSFLENFEWLARIMAEFDRGSNTSPAFVLDEARFATFRAQLISSYEERLRIEEALRTVILATPDRPVEGRPRRRYESPALE